MKLLCLAAAARWAAPSVQRALNFNWKVAMNLFDVTLRDPSIPLVRLLPNSPSRIPRIFRAGPGNWLRSDRSRHIVRIV
jgi:hypothetical protein